MAEEKEKGDALTFQDISAEVAGVYPTIMQKGETDIGAWSCGMVVGLINDIPTVAELVESASKFAPL